MTTNFGVGMTTLAKKTTKAMSQAPWWSELDDAAEDGVSVSRPRVRVRSIGRRFAGR